jgi:uncharacterized protein YecT (DUF1311 family)
MSLIKKTFVFLLLVSLHSMSFGQTQAEMNTKAYEGYKIADRKLNLVYRKIINEYATQAIFIQNFKNAQRLWVQLRDAELKAKYPQHGTYGSVEPMCVARFLEQLTNERIKYLNVWLEGIEEGDYCTGSVKMKKGS